MAPNITYKTLPACRPSAVPKGAAALPHRPDGRVQASSEEAAEAVFRQLGTSERHLEVWMSMRHRAG